jgi:RNA polymerase sigma-70 factor (ECF subfamily)
VTAQSFEDDGVETSERTREPATDSLDLDALYRSFSGELSRLIVRLAGPADAADLLHEVFLVVQRRLPEFRGDAAPKTWIYSIALRVVTARRRKQRLRRLLWLERGEPDSNAEPAAEHTPESLAEGRQATRAVHAVLDRLSERDRTLIVLFELEGLSGDAIAGMLGTTENAVWVALHRARARFREQFGVLYGHEGGAP